MNTNKLVRRLLMLTGIALVAIGCGWLYFTSGRFIATDNAYVKSSKILITPQVTGTIIAVSVTDNQAVKSGDVLFIIDPAGYQIAADEAKADLASAYTKIGQLKAQYRQKQAELSRAQVESEFAKEEFERRVNLAKEGAIAISDFNKAKQLKDASIKAVVSLHEQISGILAALTGDADIQPEQHPLYQKAQAALREAELALTRTTVRAPVDGMVGTAPHVGDYARTGVPTLNLIGSSSVWIEANYKETELTHVRIGQPVSIRVDTYPGHIWQGQVESISPATGSEFSVLPAQNATGNWVKVVQRIAVRISVDPDSSELPLRTGMSSEVTIDTGRYPNSLKQQG